MIYPMFTNVNVPIGKADIVILTILALLLVGCLFRIRGFFKK